MAQILPIVLMLIVCTLVFTAAVFKLSGHKETPGKYNPKTQKVFIFMIGTPLYLMAMVQLIRVFERFNPQAILY